MADKNAIEFLIFKFKEKFEGRVNIHNLNSAISSYEEIIGMLEKISAYAFLNLQTQLQNQRALEYYQDISEWLSQCQADLVFFDIELVKLDLKSIDKNSKYFPWIENCFRFKDHLLSNNEEKILALKQTTSISSWMRMYDEILARMKFNFKGENISLPEVIEIANHDDDGENRKIAALALAKGLNDHEFYIKSIYNNIILDRSIDNNIRKYNYCEEFRHLSNNIDRESVEHLRDAVVENYKRTAHKYYEIKAKLLGKERLEYWDKNASVKKSKILDKKFSYEEAVDITLRGFNKFSPEFKDIAQQFINSGWIDVMPSPGKTSGAFSHHCSCEIHPYILLNFFGSIRDVSTLAHELGHGIHQVLAARNGPLLADTPITLSEVASLFGEKLIFEELLSGATNNLEKVDLLCSKLDDTINSVIRQIAFFEFERSVHNKRKERELSARDISNIWMEKQNECLGLYVNIDERTSNYWCYISHFFQAPFYVYAYAFGEIFVNALYKKYKTSDKEEFTKKYTLMLSNGGIEKYDVAASKFDLDPKSMEFWNTGVDVIANQVNELEDLCASLSLC